MYKPYQDQENQKTGNYRPQGPREQKKEYGSGKEDYVICPHCQSVYAGKGWHHKSEFDIERLKKQEKVREEQCPACEMIKEKRFQGEVIITGPPSDKKNQIKNIAENYGEKAFKEDPMDRVISIQEKEVKRPTAKEKRGKESRDEVKGRIDIRILTTENQLAVRIAKKIEESFGQKPELDIKHSHKDKVSRAKVEFSDKE